MKPEELTLSPQLFLIDQKEVQRGYLNEFRLTVQEPIKPLALYALCSADWGYQEIELTRLYLGPSLQHLVLPLRALSLWAPSPPAFWKGMQSGPFIPPGYSVAACLETDDPTMGCRVALMLLGLVVREKSKALLPPKLRIESEGGEETLFYEEQSGGSVDPAKAALFLGEAEKRLFGKGGTR